MGLRRKHLLDSSSTQWGNMMEYTTELEVLDEDAWQLHVLRYQIAEPVIEDAMGPRNR